MSERIARLAEALRQEGVRGVFGIPGSGLSLQLITELASRSVPFWGTAHEGAAAIMAGAFGRQGGSLGCSLSIKGPGLANLLPGIVSNHYEQWPTLSIAEAFGPAAPVARMHKRLDQERLLSGVVNAYATLGDPAETLAALAELARTDVSGPVHLDLFAEEGGRLQAFREAPGRPANADSMLSEMERRVRAARRPVVIVGSSGVGARWADALGKLRVPVFTTVAAKGALDERSAWSAGIFTGDGKERTPEARVIPAADLVIGLGLRNLEVLSPRPFAAPCLLLDRAGARVTEGFGAEAALDGADESDFETVLAALSVAHWGEEEVAGSAREIRHSLVEQKWLPGRLLAELETLLPARRTLVVDTGAFCTVAEHVWRASEPREFLCSANGRYMGTSVPMAIGAALADRSRPVVCAAGDGGIRMYFAEIKLAIEHRLPILFLFLSDGRYGSIASALSRPGLNLEAVTMARPSWYAAAEALGCPAARVQRLDDALTAARGWNFEAGPLFLEAAFDPEAYMQMTEGIR